MLLPVLAFLLQYGEPRMESRNEQAARIFRQMDLARQLAEVQVIAERHERAAQNRACVEALDGMDAALHGLHDAGSTVKPEQIHGVVHVGHMKALDKAARTGEKAIKAVRRECFAR